MQNSNFGVNPESERTGLALIGTYVVDMINLEQPRLVLTYVVVLGSRIPKIPILVFYYLLLTYFFPLEALAKNCKNIAPV